MHNKKVNVFYSYSHADEAMKDSLLTHLASTKHEGLIDEWHDRKILPGELWDKEIDNAINKAEIILLLISPNFINSEYCMGKELKVAMEKHENGTSVVIPIILKYVFWTNLSIAKLQALPKNAKPIDAWDDLDEAYLNTVKGIRDSIKDFIKKNSKKETNKVIKISSMKDLLGFEIPRIDNAFNSLSVGGISTGLNEFDNIIDGLKSSQLIVVAADSTVGKSCFVTQLALNTSISESVATAFVTLKSTSNRLTQNLIASLVGIDVHSLIRAELEEHDWPKLTSAVTTLKNAPLYIIDTPTLNIKELKEQITILKIEHGLKVLIIDSMQYLEFNSKGVENNNISKFLKLMAKELDIAIIITASVLKKVHERPNKRPVIQDLSLWGSLSDDADVIACLYRENVYNPESHINEIIIVKNSNGPICHYELDFEECGGRFVEFVFESDDA